MKKANKIETLSLAEQAKAAVVAYQNAARRSVDAEEAAHQAALAAQKAKIVAQKAVDALKMETAEQVKSFGTVVEGAAKISASVKAKRAEV